MNKQISMMNDISEMIHNNIIKSDTIYPLVFIGYISKKFEIDIHGEFENLISFISYLKDNIDNLSYSSDEKNLLSESLNMIMGITNQYNFSEMIKFIIKYDKTDYLDFIRVPINIERGSVTTLSNINELIIELLNIKKNSNLLDMSCGNGNLLTEVVDKNIGTSVTGYETNMNELLYTRIRMYMLNCDFSYEISSYNDEVNNSLSYDSIVCIPPFGLNVCNDNLTYKNFEYKNGNSYYWSYVDKAISIMKTKGKAIFVFPKMPMFKIPDSNIREYLIRNKLVEKIIELPDKLFSNTSIGTIMLVLSKNNNTVKVIDASEMSLKVNRFISNIDINKVMNCIENNSKYSKDIVDKDFENNNFSFIPSIYTKDVSKKMKNPVLLKNYITAIRGYRGTIESELKENTCKYLKLTNIVDGEVIKDTLSNIKYDESLDKYLLKDKDVVITARGSRFECAVVRIKDNEKIVCGENFFILRVLNQELNSYYLSVFLNSDKGQESIFSKQVRTTILSLKSEELLNSYIDLISKDKQKQIEKIEENKFILKDSYRSELLSLNNKLNELLK